MKRLLAIALLALPLAVHAEQIFSPGVLYTSCAAACVTGAAGATKFARPKAATALAVQYTISGTATFQIEQCVEASPEDCTANSSWFVVAGSSSSTNHDLKLISPVVGYYRTNLTAYTNGTVKAVWRSELPGGS